MWVKKFRRAQTIFSVTMFFIIFLACLCLSEKNIDQIQLSHWGVEGNMSYLWNSSLILLSVSIYFNVLHYMNSHTRVTYVHPFKMLFLSISISLFFTGLITMDYDVHDWTAFYYFFAYPGTIFLFAHWNRKHLPYREWLTHVIFSSLMVLVPISILKLFPGMAIPEMSHTVLVAAWNLWLLRL